MKYYCISLKISRFADGVDINCGCPQRYYIIKINPYEIWECLQWSVVEMINLYL
jgi:hypothetical protein